MTYAKKFSPHSNYCANISLQVQQHLLKIRLSQSSSSSCIIGKHQYKWYVYTILLIAHFLYFSAHYSRSRPLFRFSHRRLVHRCQNSPTNIKIWHLINKWLFGLHSCVIFNTFRFQSTHFMVTENIKLEGNFKLSPTKLFTCKIIYVQVERIVISIRRELISLQFYSSL